LEELQLEVPTTRQEESNIKKEAINYDKERRKE
jgi:hypothetical protein